MEIQYIKIYRAILGPAVDIEASDARRGVTDHSLRELGLFNSNRSASQTRSPRLVDMSRVDKPVSGLPVFLDMQYATHLAEIQEYRGGKPAIVEVKLPLQYIRDGTIELWFNTADGKVNRKVTAEDIFINAQKGELRGEHYLTGELNSLRNSEVFWRPKRMSENRVVREGGWEVAGPSFIEKMWRSF